MLGPALAIATVLLIEALQSVAIRVPARPAIILSLVIFSAFAGGLPAGLTSAAVSVLYFAYLVSGAQGTNRGGDAASAEVILGWAAASIGSAIAAWWLKHRLDLASHTARNTAVRDTEAAERRKALADRILLASIVESADDAIISSDLAGVIRTWNPAAERLFGYTAAEAIGRPIFIIVPPEKAEEGKRIRKELREGKTVSRYETVRMKKDGSLVDIALTAFPLKNAEGELIGTSSISRDVTARLQAARLLGQSEEKYRLLFEANPQPMWVFDLETLRFLAVNEAAIKHYGYSRDEFHAMTIKEIRPPDAVPELLAVLSRGAPGFTHLGARPHRKKDGTVIQVETRRHTLTYEGHNAALVLVNDITDRKRAETALAQSEERYKLLFERNPIPMWVTDLEDLSFLAVNEAATLHYGYSLREFLSMKVPDIFLERGEAEAVHKEALRQSAGRIGRASRRHRKKDGTAIDVEVTHYSLSFGGRRARLVMVNDVSERKALEDQLRHAQKMEAVGQLAGGVAHDFNNLLTGITGYADLLLEKLGNQPHAADLKQIQVLADRAAELTRQLLAFSRRQPLQPKVIDLNRLIDNLLQMLKRLIGAQISLEFTPGAGLGSIRADPGQIEQVLVNLVVNARDATPAGGRITIRTSNVDMDTDHTRHNSEITPGPYVQMAVTDTGCGMDEPTLLRMFEPFFTTKEVGKGTGLGLSTVYGIVKQHEGHVIVESQPGEGTSFKIYWRRSAELPELEEPATVSETAPNESNATILVVEDNRAVGDLVQRVLQKGGYNVLFASTPEKAEQIFQSSGDQVALLLTDVVLPVKSGPELFQQLSIDRPELKVLYMSGHTERSVPHRTLMKEGSNFIQKPFTPTALLERIHSVLSTRGQ